MTGDAKIAFNNVDEGNGPEAWRTVAVPTALRSEAKLHAMHKRVNNTPVAARMTDLGAAIAKWEGELKEYYKAGGDNMPDKTKIINVMSMLPSNAPASMRLALKGIDSYLRFKDELEEQVRFLEDFGGPSRLGSRAPGARALATYRPDLLA